MNRLALALVLSATAVSACGGIEELALNPEDQAVAGTVNQAQGGSTTQPAQGGTAGTAAVAAPIGGTSHGGQASAQAGSSPALCAGDASCTSAGAPRCRGDGRCVACITDNDCANEDLHCDVPSGACALGAPSDANGGSDGSGGDGSAP